MERKTSLAILCAAFLLLAASAVTASSLAPESPLYLLRMEQMSSKMNFLPTAVNGFTYLTEGGYNVNSGFRGCFVEPGPPATHVQTCNPPTCYYTCQGMGWTCDATGCLSTCITCVGETCPSTCEYTCDDPTCAETCESTCRYTCTKPCVP